MYRYFNIESLKLVGEAALYTALLYWFVGVSLPLDVALACIATSVRRVSQTVSYNRMTVAFNPTVNNTAELASDLAERVADLENKLREAEFRIEDLTRDYVKWEDCTRAFSWLKPEVWKKDTVEPASDPWAAGPDQLRAKAQKE